MNGRDDEIDGAIAVEGRLFILSAIEEMPSEFLALIQQRQPRYQKPYSRTDIFSAG